MEFLQLIPDSVQASSGNPPTAIGAAASDPVEDVSDSTYIQITAANQWFRLSFADITLPSNKRIWGVYGQIREYFVEQVDGSGWGFTWFAYIGPSTVTEASGQKLAGAASGNNVEGSITTRSSPWHNKDWTGVEWTQAQINAAHWYYKVNPNSPLVYERVVLVRLGYALVTQPVAAVTSPLMGQTGISKSPTIQWSYTGFGEAQKSYRVKVFSQAVAEGGGFDPATSATVYDSGVVVSSNTNHNIPAGVLALNTVYYVSVQVTKSMDQYGMTTGLSDYASLWATATKFTVNAAPVATVTAPADPTNNSTTPAVTWTYTDADGNLQQTYQIRVFTAAQYGIGGFDPATSPATWDSGEVLSADVSAAIGVVIANATYRAYVRVSDSDGNYSAWAFKQWVQSVTPPNAPLLVATQIAGTSDVLLQLERAYNGPIPDFFRLERSDDGGATWEDVRGGEYQALPMKIVDTFTRADNAATMGNAETGGAWVPNTGVFGIQTNRAYTAAATVRANATIDTLVSDIIAHVTVPVLPGANGAGLIFRYSAAGEFWAAAIVNAQLFLIRRTGGASTNQLGPFAAAAGDVIGVKAVGSTIQLYQNGVLKGTVVDATNVGNTKHGLYLDNTNVARLDDFDMMTYLELTDREVSPRKVLAGAETYRYRLTVYDQLIGNVSTSQPTTVSGILDVRKVFLKLPKLYAVTDSFVNNLTFPVEDVFLSKAVNKQRSVHRPMGRTRPVVVRGVNEGRSFSTIFVTETQAKYDSLLALLNRNVTLLMVTSKAKYYVDVQNITDDEHLWDELHSELPIWRITVGFQEVDRPD